MVEVNGKWVLWGLVYVFGYLYCVGLWKGFVIEWLLCICICEVVVYKDIFYVKWLVLFIRLIILFSYEGFFCFCCGYCCW